jgi:hypothetical protein
MPDNISPLTPQNQIDWHGMLHDLEKSMEQLSDAVDGVRMSVRRIVMAEAWLPQTTVEPVAPAPLQTAPAPVAEPVVDQVAPLDVPKPGPVAPETTSAPEAVADLAPEPTPVEEEASRELVQRFVDDVRAERDEASAAMAAADEDRDARESVRLAVEQARAELTGPKATSDVAPPVWTEEESREAVRRAVEQARAELAAGHAPDLSEAPLAARPMPQRPVNPQHLLPTLTIEDPESRVELSRVYGLLQRLGVASQASLLNYTSRQVSVMLGAEAARLSTDDFVSAVGQTMGRRSRASQDGANVIVELGGSKEEAA